MPLYGALPTALPKRLEAFQQAGVLLVLVLNQPDCDVLPDALQPLLTQRVDSSVHVVSNRNRGGVAGGFNRGVERAVASGADWITLLDQDSDLQAEQLISLREPWQHQPFARYVVGPCIWDARRGHWHGRRTRESSMPWIPARLLISSGTTFRASDWPVLGMMQEWLVVDFVDHAWSFQVQARGFQLLQHPDVVLKQRFGCRHPNALCRWLGMELYPPRRHFYSLRNLRWLLRRSEIPLDLKLKEVVKMIFKPWFWLLFEPERVANFKAMLRAVQAPLPVSELE